MRKLTLHLALIFSIFLNTLGGIGETADASHGGFSLLSPLDGGTVSVLKPLTLKWSDPGGVLNYDIAIGSCLNCTDYLWLSGIAAENVSIQTYKKTPPVNSKVYVRIHANFTSGGSHSEDFDFKYVPTVSTSGTTSGSTSSTSGSTTGTTAYKAPTYLAPNLVSPVNGSTISSDKFTLKWSNEGTDTTYAVAIGTYQSAPDYLWWESGEKGINGLTINGFKKLAPKSGTVHVRLFSYFTNGTQKAKDYTLKTSSTFVGSTSFTNPTPIKTSTTTTGTTAPSTGTTAPTTGTTTPSTGTTTPSTGSTTPTTGTTTPSTGSSEPAIPPATNVDLNQTCATGTTKTGGKLCSVWANDGGDKITRDEDRGSKSATAVLNSVWNGEKISLFGAKNEVVNFNTILESTTGASSVAVSFDKLVGPNGAEIKSVAPTSTSGTNLFNWTNRDIESFYIRYLPIKGLSRLSYELYDERHIPKRFRRPNSTGGWTNRPDADKYYPEIAVPLELKPTFTIAAGDNQSIWTDIYIPKDKPSGIYKGNLIVSEAGKPTKTVPVELSVKNFTLPDEPSSKTMVFMGHGNINERYLGVKWPNDNTASIKIRDQFFKLAHRHKISLIDDDQTSGDQPSAEWKARLTGSLFTAANGYKGPGESKGNGVYSIGTYGSWGWKDEGEAGMRKHTDSWANWFATNAPATEYFLYLIDESDDYATIQKWSKWINDNPGAGKAVKSFATISLPAAVANTPDLDIPASWITVGDTQKWNNALSTLKSKAGKKFYTYNGKRPANGSFATEDDGVALRELAWAQYKKGVDRWFFWESTYWDNFQGGTGLTNVFKQAHTFGGNGTTDSVIGQTGWNYSNGDGVLFYPGTDKVFTSDSYGIGGPIASIRLKEWRRGIQDIDYVNLAYKKNPTATMAIVNKMVLKALWDYGVDDPYDPSWVKTDISWSTNPDDWEAARKALAAIIES